MYKKLLFILFTGVALFTSPLSEAKSELPLGVLHLLLKKQQSWWGVVSEVHCSLGSQQLTFSVTIEGITKESICENGSCATSQIFGIDGNPGFGSFEGWVTTEPGTKTFSYTIDAPDCGGVLVDSNYITFENGKTYLFTLILYDHDNNPATDPIPAVGTYTFPGYPPAP